MRSRDYCWFATCGHPVPAPVYPPRCPLRSIRAPREHFFFNDTATTEIYTLSLHDALPICAITSCPTSTIIFPTIVAWYCARYKRSLAFIADRKSTRLNSSHLVTSYAV